MRVQGTALQLDGGPHVSDDHDLVQEVTKSSRLEGGGRGGCTKLSARLLTPRRFPHLLRQQVEGLLGVSLGQGTPQLSTGTCGKKLGVISRARGLAVGPTRPLEGKREGRLSPGT